MLLPADTKSVSKRTVVSMSKELLMLSGDVESNPGPGLGPTGRRSVARAGSVAQGPSLDEQVMLEDLLDYLNVIIYFRCTLSIIR